MSYTEHMRSKDGKRVQLSNLEKGVTVDVLVERNQFNIITRTNPFNIKLDFGWCSGNMKSDEILRRIRAAEYYKEVLDKHNFFDHEKATKGGR